MKGSRAGCWVLLAIWAVPGFGGAQPAPAADPVPQGVLELEDHARAFAEAADRFRSDVVFQLQWEISRKKQGLMAAYQRERRRLDQEMAGRRKEAIAVLERFVEHQPNHPLYTPEVLFRLAKLYYDQAQDDYMEAYAAYEEQRALHRRGKVADAPEEPRKNLDQAIRTYERILERFPSFRNNDAVLYALGFTLRQVDEPDRATEVFQRLVRDHPRSNWVPDAWLMVGEALFEQGRFADAVAAYRQAMGDPGARFYGIALYKLAWSHFQMFDYPTAIRTFKQLIDYLDGLHDRSDRATQIRNEAVEYLALSLADEDWNGDGLPDPDATVARAIAFLSDGKPFEREVLERYGDALYQEFEKRKYPMALDAYRAVIALDPMDPRNAAVKEKIIRVYETMRDEEGAVAERQDLVRTYGPGTPWYERNRDHPEVLARVDRRMEIALHQVAQFHKGKAKGLRDQAVRSGDPAYLSAAVQQYRLAAEAFQDYLRRFPDSRYAYENTYDLADCLYYSFEFARAAEIYRRVRDWPNQQRYREAAAFNVIDALEKEGAKAVQDGRMAQADVPGEAGEVQEERPPAGVSGRVEVRPLPLSPLVQQCILDVDYYVQNGLGRADDPELPARLAYRVAAELYQRRHLEEARKRFAAVMERFPGSQVAIYSAQAIINSYRMENDWENIQIWAQRIEERQLGRAEDRAALAAEVRLFQLGAAFQEAERLFEAGQYVEAAEAFVKVVDQDPKIKLADKALQNAALAYEKARRHESASRVYERLIRDYPASPFVEGALVRLADSARKVFDFQKAVDVWGDLIRRFPKSENVPLGLVTQADMLEAMERYRDAARILEQYADRVADPAESARALFQAGTLWEKNGNGVDALRVWKRLLQVHGGTREAALLVLDALSRMARMARADNNPKEFDRLAREVVRRAEALGVQPDTPEAAFPAQALFQLTEPRFEEYSNIRFRGSLKVQGQLLQKKARMLGELENDYRRVLAWQSAEWSAAASYRMAQIHELFAQALFEAEIPEMSQEDMDTYQNMLEDRVHVFRETAQRRYEEMVSETRRLRVSNEWTRKALEALHRYRPNEVPAIREERRALDFTWRRQAPGFEEGL